MTEQINIRKTTIVAAALLIAALGGQAVDAKVAIAEELGTTPEALEVVADPTTETPADDASDSESDAPGSTGDSADESAETVAASEATEAPEADTGADEVPAAEAPTEFDEVIDESAQTEDVYTITAAGDYQVTGEGHTAIHVDTTEEVTLTLDAVKIDATGTGHSAISMVKGASVSIFVKGDCELTGDVNCAGIEVPADAELTIEGDVEAGSITCIGNAGIDYSTTAAGKAAGSTAGSGIGGTRASGESGAITINGHGLNLTVSAIGGGTGAAGIGSCGASSGAIAINGANLVGIHGGCHNAAVEGDAAYAKSTLEGGAGIGSGGKGGQTGAITISGCHGTDIVGGGKSAGIGGGCWSTDVSVSITGSDLTVDGGTTGAAIGSGRANAGLSMSVSIVDSTVNALGGYLGAGIGLGFNASNYNLNLTDVTISHSTVIATGGAGAAGIGGGARGYNVNVTIDDASNILAYGGANYQAGYTEKYNKAAGGIGQSGAAAVGRGAWGSVDFADGKGAYSENQMSPMLAISADSDVVAIAMGDNWAIAGFTNIDDVDASVLQLRFSRNYGLSKGHDGGADFDTRASWEGTEACFLDGQIANELSIRDANTLRTLSTIVTPELDESFENGYAGNGIVGYYTIAVTVDGAGDYKVYSTSTLLDADDVDVNPGSDRYHGGVVSHDSDAEGLDVFAVSKGINSFDKCAFLGDVDPEPMPEPESPSEVTPDSDVTPEPERVPEVAPEAAPAQDGESSPAATVVPTTPGTSDVVTTSDAPAATTAATPGAPVASAVSIPDAQTPLAPGATTTAPATSAASSAATAGAAIAATIADEAAPLAAHDHEDCWVHWWVMLGMLLTGSYGLGTILKRSRNSKRLQSMEDEVLGKASDRKPASAPAATAQPALNANS